MYLPCTYTYYVHKSHIQRIHITLPLLRRSQPADTAAVRCAQFLGTRMALEQCYPSRSCRRGRSVFFPSPYFSWQRNSPVSLELTYKCNRMTVTNVNSRLHFFFLHPPNLPHPIRTHCVDWLTDGGKSCLYSPAFGSENFEFRVALNLIPARIGRNVEISLLLEPWGTHTLQTLRFVKSVFFSLTVKNLKGI